MDISENTMTLQDKFRIIQELVPGKQISLAHVIAAPDEILYQKLGLNPNIDYSNSAIGILTISPAETAVIAADIAMKSSNVELGFVDRFSGTLIITGKVSDTDTAMRAILSYAKETLDFAVCEITRT
ncbi:MAG: BMC domain-containing protein [Ruminococcaceae bacterium]|nr:BMC domain-containing protein [Oscillospiraceae bacterium]